MVPEFAAEREWARQWKEAEESRGHQTHLYAPGPFMAATRPGVPGVHAPGRPPMPPLGDATRNPGRHHPSDSRHVARVFLS